MIFTREKKFYQMFNALYWVLILQNIITFGVNLADNVMIGSYSEAALSGVAAVNQLQFFFQQIIMSAGDAVVVLCSQYWGQKRTAEMKKIVSSALYVGAFLGLVLFILATVCPRALLGMFTDSPAIIAEGVKYIGIIKYTYIIFAITNLLLAGLRAAETVRIAFAVSCMTLVINCSINYVLIFGKLGAPEMGVSGAAIGTLIARIVELIVVLLYILLADKKLCFRIRELMTPHLTLLCDYIKTAWRFMLVGAMFGASTALQTVILGHMTDAAIAANSAATTLYQVIKVASIGAASAASVIIGKTIGAAKSYAECLPRLRDYVKTLQVMFLGIGLVSAAVLFLLRVPVLSLYSSLSPEAYAMARQFILVLCVTCIGTSYQMPVIVGIIRGGGDSKFVLINDLVSIWGIVLPVSFVAAFVLKAPPVAVVFCLNSDQIFKCAAAAIKVNRYRWVHKLTRGA